MGVTAPHVSPRPFGPALDAFATEVGAEGAVAVEGGRTAWHVGGPPASGTTLVSAPAGILALTPDEMTVRVGTGTRVAELHEALAEHGQETALPVRSGGTVGGALMVGWSDLRRFGRGPVRNALLEASYVGASGQLVRAGGPTVKNVTGYDLCRLLVGSLGTLGLVGEVVLRTRPRPAASRWLTGRVRADEVATLTARAPSTTSCCLWDGESVWWLLEGDPHDVDRHSRALGTGTVEEVEGPPELPPNRWSIDPASIPAAAPSFGERFVAELGVGTVHADRPQQGLRPSAQVRRLARRTKEVFDPTGRLNPGRDVFTP
jgi:FAD/FMN-containing dehydrogenase